MQIKELRQKNPGKFNMEPENGEFEDDFPFQGGCILRFHGH